MSLFAGLVGAERKSSSAVDSLFSALIDGASLSKSGQAVNVEKALRVSAVLGCVRVLAEGIAQLPLKLYREKENGGKEIAKDHPLHLLLSRRPNDWQTSVEFREGLMFHAVLDKGGFAVITRASDGRVLELLPVVPSAVTVRQDSAWGVSYDISDANGRFLSLPRERVFCVRGPSWNNLEALQIVREAKEAIGLAISTEEAQARLHANGARPAGLLSTEKELKKEQKDRLRALWSQSFGGDNQFGTAVLDLGMKYQQLTMTGVDAQTLESRRHQVEEIARMFRVFPQMLGYSDKTSTYASAEQFFIAHVIHSLGPWIERWEQAISRDLLTRDEAAAGMFAKFSVQGLLRGDAAARAEYYKASLGTSSSPGWNTPNDIRRLEDQDPLDDPGADEIVTVQKLAGKPADPTAPDKKTARGPTETKVGRVLSGANERRIVQARDHLDEVLDQLGPVDAGE